MAPALALAGLRVALLWQWWHSVVPFAQNVGQLRKARPTLVDRVSVAVAAFQVQIAPASRAQALAVRPAKWLHFYTELAILTNCLREVQLVVLDCKGVRIDVFVLVARGRLCNQLEL